MSAVNPLPDLMSAARFLDWQPIAARPSDRWQLIDGTPCLMAPSSLPHGAIQAEAASLIRNHLLTHRPGCAVATEPGIQPRIGADTNVRIPDLAVTCSPINRDDKLMRDPVLIIEILSVSNRAETWANVWSYASIASVAEIAVLYVATMRIDLLRRQPDGSWPDNPETFADDAVIRLDSLGFATAVSAFYRTLA